MKKKILIGLGIGLGVLVGVGATYFLLKGKDEEETTEDDLDFDFWDDEIAKEYDEKDQVEVTPMPFSVEETKQANENLVLVTE